MKTAALEGLSKHIPGCVEKVVRASWQCGRHQRLGVVIVVLFCLMKVIVDCGSMHCYCSGQGFSLQGKQTIPQSSRSQHRYSTSMLLHQLDECSFHHCKLVLAGSLFQRLMTLFRCDTYKSDTWWEIMHIDCYCCKERSCDYPHVSFCLIAMLASKADQ